MSASASCADTMEEEKLHASPRESSREICFQVLPSYLLAGLGMVTAGMVLDRLQVSDTSTHHIHSLLHTGQTLINLH